MNNIVENCLKYEDGSFSFDWEFIDTVPEFHNLHLCNQNPKWHAEGDAWEHTLLTCNAMLDLCKILDDEKYSEEKWVMQILDSEYDPIYIKKVLLVSALFHDIGKTVTTFEKNGVWHSYGHETAGEKITRRMLWDEDSEFREDVCFIVREHMKILNIFDSKDPYEALYKLSQTGKLALLILVKYADLLGSVQEPSYNKDADIEKLGFALKVVSDSGCCIKPFKAWFPNKKYPWKVQKDYVDVIVMIGLPGSGKNTYIENQLQYFVSVSRDDIREELGFTQPDEKAICSPEQEDAVTVVFNNKLLSAVSEGKCVVINNINLKKSYRDAYKELLKKYNVKYTYIIVESSTENLKKRRDFLTDKVISGMIEKFDYPLPDEYDKLFIIEN